MKPDLFAPVSVIIPCYNCRETIERAVKSVFEQIWRPSEVILVDDASTDGTPEVLLELQKFYGRKWVKVILRKKNGGPGAARNTGWDLATQPYIAFLDADDAWHPEKIAIQLKYMMEHSDVVITGHGVRWFRSVDISITPLPTHFTIKPISRLQILLSNRLSTISVMLKREIDFRFEPTKRFSEDYLLWLSIILSGNKAAFIYLELAYTYKALYGQGGLSGDLWNMEKGELENYYILFRKKLINFVLFIFVSFFSLIKYLRRSIIIRFMNFMVKEKR
ncbi:MAG: glycosyltransferase family 2 protein [Fervidobacterium sp.]